VSDFINKKKITILAKKRKGAKKTHRRRRVSGVHPMLKNAAMTVAGAVAGGVAGAFVNQTVKTSFATMPTYTGGAVCVLAAGAALAFMKPSPLITGFAAGLAGAGGIFAINETLLSLPGISGMPGMPIPARTSGINQTVGRMPRRVGGTFSGNNSATVAGIMEN
jgi:hypothetical protein